MEQIGHAMQQEFLIYEQAAERFGSAEALRQSIIHSAFPTYVLLEDAPTRVFNSGDVPTLTDGGTKFSSWAKLPSWAESDGIDANSVRSDLCYFLTGWFLLPHRDARRVVHNRERRTGLVTQLRVAGPPPAKLSKVLAILEGVPIFTQLSETWFRKTDINRFLSGGPTVEDSDHTRAQPRDAKINANLTDGTPKVRNRNPSTYMPIIHALATIAEVSPGGQCQRLVELLGSIGCNTDAEVAEHVLQAAFSFTSDRYETARDRKSNPYKFEHSDYLPIIYALTELTRRKKRGLVKTVHTQVDILGSRKRDGTTAVKPEDITVQKPGRTTISDVLKEARSYVRSARAKQ